MLNPSWSSVIKLTQTISPNLLNETAFLYSGNKITLTPVPARRYLSFSPLDGQLPASSRCQQCWQPAARDQPSGLAIKHELELELLPLEELATKAIEWRDDLSWTKGKHQFKFGFSWLHDYKNQQLQANTQGTAVFQLQLVLR